MAYMQSYGSRPSKPAPTTRVCKDCAKEQPIANFPTYGALKWRRSRCRPCYNENSRLRHKAAYAADPEKFKARQRDYNRRKKTGDIKTTFLTREETVARRAAGHQKQKAQVKAETFAAYGGAICACCAEDNIAFLTLDHIEGGGNEEGRRTGRRGGWNSYRLLRDKGYPPGYQVLCYNCNSGRHHNGGICPHKE